ncbi:VIT1/CCC1 transporter family protein [Actinopolymorpha pittospori]|uniref:VIT1/CCC1 family predicted Fe2+/Mn2+ transporter n=1 Tax=Actinopolymorpha pittospori TaxID=648752 RepID=A0A927N1B3_9ACTN|nr:VIT1/CCC1 family protein [Actinopolymorpha pittospori]MBE1607122.1 VIT1/CCC1 family predicted Fe2+/Mn2+ transporter [Actinopolymorpha pittospori]
MGGDARSGPVRSPARIRRWRRMLADEREEARVYRELASRSTGEERDILLALADAESRHAAHWERLLGAEVGQPRRGRPKMRLLASLARRFGWLFVLALMQQAESQRYASVSDAPASMAADERIHSEVVRALAARGRSRLSGTLRAAVFGANDGLVSNVSLVLGVIGGGASSQTVLLTGLSGLLAGALSMAAGEYVSVSSQRELLAAVAPEEAVETALPQLDVDANELALVYRARGMSAEEAERRARAVLQEQPVGPALGVPGTADSDVVGTAIGAATASFAFFAGGALVPVLPFIFGVQGLTAVVVACVLTGAALMLTGGTVGVLSGASPLRRALRQLAIGVAAATVTFLLGLGLETVLH